MFLDFEIQQLSGIKSTSIYNASQPKKPINIGQSYSKAHTRAKHTERLRELVSMRPLTVVELSIETGASQSFAREWANREAERVKGIIPSTFFKLKTKGKDSQ